MVCEDHTTAFSLNIIGVCTSSVSQATAAGRKHTLYYTFKYIDKYVHMDIEHQQPLQT